MRLLIARVYESSDDAPPLLRKEDLYRVPLRLGEDAFTHGALTPRTQERFLQVMSAFKQLIDFFEPEDFMACATSALRSCANGPATVERVWRELGLRIDIIDGEREADLIAFNRDEGQYDKGDYLFVDVGGGSTELTILHEGSRVMARSFKIGTVRLKQGLVNPEEWRAMEAWIFVHTPAYEPLTGIGSGGNINKIFKMTGRKKKEGLPVTALAAIHSELAEMSMESRMRQLGLRHDRADVIVPAAQIYLRVARWAGLGRYIVPQIGLSDGMVRYMHRRYLEGLVNC
ncbi:putative Ppx/GppA phosphatase [Magnetofaba australis IT-1]|uniref:Putative Ppx/GppA phosphatase n=1 Tax=Magnetofaba australis IT-1 TaxID=1434232 RepID=A0A1Y2K0S0_9PROT|nr:putative Ppx/GppA phosphatase [Magnetofaba australis IT-1]